MQKLKEGEGAGFSGPITKLQVTLNAKMAITDLPVV